MIDGLLPYVIGGAVIATGLAGWQGYKQGFNAGENAIKVEWAKAQQRERIKTENLILEFNKKQNALDKDVESMRESYVNEIDHLNATVDSLLKRLRLAERARTRNTSGSNTMPDTASTKPDDRERQECNGSQLRFVDQEFLVRQAQRADSYRLLLTECRAVVEAFRQ